ncbi:MAG TPA: segregation/condensation protein A [Gemmatimonadaceae bacterium]|nr:segregation/condensation protein A [Gemmatimonadaceae bacterium]
MDDVSMVGTQPGTSEVFLVDLVEFSGPLDLLLSLIRDEQIDIYDIPIARIAEQFLARISTLKLDEAADYLEMAARLVRIKAQLLLPRREGEDVWDDPRAELVRRLLEYQQVREVVDVLERRAEDRRSRFARAYSQQADLVPVSGPLRISLPELLSAVDRVLRLAKKPHVHDVVPRALDVDGAMGIVRALLAIRAHAQWKDVLPRNAEPWEVLSVLLALLELAKRGELRLNQPRAFGAFDITRDPASEAA